MVVIVGAGLAGLTCARELIAAGKQVLVVEASDGVGGRVRSDVTADGYVLDRGFQVLFTAYPAIKRHIQIEALKPRTFDPGAILVKQGKQYEIADPLRQPDQLVAGLLNPLISPADKLRVIRLVAHVTKMSAAEIFEGKDQPEGQDETIEQYLRRQGFEDGFIDNFVRPFYGGILLDRSLSLSARIFEFTFKMLATGNIIIPAEGMQRLPEQLAAGLPEGSLRLHSRVEGLQIQDGRVQGVRLSNGEFIAAEQVVVATESPMAEKLTGMKLPDQPMSSRYFYFAGDRQLYSQKKILLNANENAFVNNAVLITNIAPTYAPPHKYLLAASVLGDPAGDDEQLAARCLAEMADWFPEHNLQHWRLVGAYRIPFSQFAQPPGIYSTLPDNTTPIEGLYLAGEYTKSSSIQGAMHSGEHAAKALLASVVGV